MNDEILFGSSEMSARQKYYMVPISKARQQIIDSCKKCDAGFIEVKEKINSVEDLAIDRAVECECRRKAHLIEKRIESGIPRQFQSMAIDARLNINVSAKETIDFYIEKIDEVYKKGLCILIVTDKFIFARQAAGIKILLNAINKGYSAHYIDMNRYFDFKTKHFRDDGINVDDFINEVEATDFLCIDNIGNIVSTEYVRNTFTSMMSERISQCLPTVLITSLNSFDDYLGSNFVNLFQPVTTIANIDNSYDEQNGFVNLKRRLSGKM